MVSCFAEICFIRTGVHCQRKIIIFQKPDLLPGFLRLISPPDLSTAAGSTGKLDNPGGKDDTEGEEGVEGEFENISPHFHGDRVLSAYLN